MQEQIENIKTAAIPDYTIVAGVLDIMKTAPTMQQPPATDLEETTVHQQSILQI